MKSFSKHILFTALVLMFVVGLSAQTNKVDSLKYNQDDEYVVPYDSLSPIDKLNYNFRFGAMIMSNGSFGTYYNPSVTYQLTKKWSINTGVTYQNVSANNMPMFTDFGYQPFTGNISQFYGYVAAKYQIDERWAVGGSVFYNAITFNNPYYAYSSNNISPMDRVGYSGFVEYKSPSGFIISGEIRVNDRFNPYNRFGGFNSGIGAGFDNSFGSPFSTW
ncbi:MAG: hypothetical protein OQJ96_07880 [Flavobacteriales bacterium]|nr:hypothetical protein [Flavobacteriales bacterium]MCW8912254.1 hypothetical protein [Flavobacteriales bacterium]MCW8937507.1 hypothetical protein [Flavobacteriales bacterium]MCW8941171.1 hypothetical protein [Flavobacteriales bacterium]MCW8967168.1 hypothetical protein [Flavobacteriales bacterium]